MRPSSQSFSQVSIRLFALLTIGLLPWTVLAGPSGIDAVFAFGLVDGRSLHFVSLPRYLSLTHGLPDRLLAWPISVLLYIAGVASAGLGAADREDARVTAGLFALAGVSHLAFVVGLYATNPTITPLPIGAVALWTAAYLTARRAL